MSACFVRSVASSRRAIYYGKPASAREVMQILKAERKQERRLKRSGLFRLRRAASRTTSSRQACATTQTEGGRGRQWRTGYSH